VLSDSHGDAPLVRAIVEEFGPSSDALVFCGDGVEDLASTFAGPEREALPPVIACVQGNGDAGEYAVPIGEREDGFEPEVFRFAAPRTIVFKAAGRTVFAAHGHWHGVLTGQEMISRSAEIMDADMVFFGHTHRPFADDTGAALILNPGSCARPRGGMPPTFAVVSCPGVTERFGVQFFRITGKGSPEFEAFPRQPG
jgi:putative phosphoesterase